MDEKTRQLKPTVQKISISLERERFWLNQLVNSSSDISCKIVDTNLISIRMLRGLTLEGSFPFTNETLQTEGEVLRASFPLKFRNSGKSHGRKKG